MLDQISVPLAALYLRGLPRPLTLPRRRWVRVVSCLRHSDCAVADAAKALRSGGFWEEAVALETQGLVEKAEGLVEEGRVLTSVDALYPQRWMERLRDSAPPALWICGTMPASLLIGIVGSRQIDPDVRHFAEEIGRETARLNFAVVSGGALGCDRSGATGAVSVGGSVIEILPYGIDHYSEDDRCGLSVCAPDEIFSTPSAMERNTLIYAASECTVIAHARFKEGGTWIGAVEATRRHLCHLIVRDDESTASKALIGLGATAISDAAQLSEAMSNPPPQSGLFGIG